MIAGIPFAIYGWISIPDYTFETWGWPWYLSFPVSMLHMGLISTIQWQVMKHSGNIWFDDESLSTCEDTQKSLFSRGPFVKNEYLAGVLLLSGLLVGFFAGREFPRETLLEKECRVWAESQIQRSADRSIFALLLGHCMSGRR
jgi:hypothetical protein